MSLPFSFRVPEEKKIRLIINTDAKNEADDQYAIVHALLTQKFCVKGIVAAHFGEARTKTSMEESFAEILRVLGHMELPEAVPVLRGAPHALEAAGKPVASEGSSLIIREALSTDPRPLFCIFLGPLTDLASAIALRPDIAGRMQAVWIGGNSWPKGGPEFNLANDILAANLVYASQVPLWQIPRNVYNKIKVSLAELQARVRPCGKIGHYLFTQMVEFNEAFAQNPGWPLGESWVLGDSAAIGVLLDPHEYCYQMYKAPRVDEEMNYIHDTGYREIRFYHDIDSRFILEDFYAKLRIFADAQ